MPGITSLDRTALAAMKWRDHIDGPLGLQDLLHVASLHGNYWSCNPDDPPRYHAKFSSGACSADFFDLKSTMETCGPFRELVAYNLARLLADQGWSAEMYQAVVGSATGSTELVCSISEITGARFVEMVKDLDGGQLAGEGQPPLRGDEMVAQFEELSTTYNTPGQVRRALHEAYGEVTFVPFVTMVVDRHEEGDHPLVLSDGSAVISLARLPSRLYQPGAGTCPMCAKGSEPIRPRHGNNWAMLTSMP